MSDRTARRGRIARLIHDQSGATAVITGITLLVIAALGFAAFDFTRANGSKTNLQDALDSAALAAARVKGDDEAAKKAGQDYLAAHLSPEEYQNLDADFEVTKDTVTATASAKVQPFFVHMFMGGPISISTDAEVKRQIDGTLEVALVLDTTLSMEGSKIDALKVAAEALTKEITKVKDADVKIGVVPFADYVNVGVSRRNEPWVDVQADYTTAAVPETNCRMVPKYKRKCTGTEEYSCPQNRDGVIVPKTCTRDTGCTNVPDGERRVCDGGQGPKNYKWKGCVGSPAYPKNVTDSDATRRYPGIMVDNNAVCAVEIQPLTDKLGPVESTIKKLNAKGYTYIPSGLAWGWNLLSKPVPFTEAATYDPSNKKPRKALVLMTDGANTMRVDGDGKHHHVGNNKPAPQADGYTAELCANIKAEKIELYTVAFQIDIASAHTMLQNCATSSSHYYKADNAEELLEAFEAIGKSLENLRISH